MTRRALPKIFSRLRHDTRGVAAVEFALIAPVMVVLYLGGVELTRVIGADRKVSLASRVAADLVARESAAISETKLTTVCKGTLAMLAPFPTGTLNITISSIVTSATGKSTIGWTRVFLNGNCSSSAAGTGPLAAGSVVSLPTGLAVNGASLISASASYDYTTLFRTVFDTATVNLGEQSYMRPRTQNTVCYVSC
ncbi:pilus assembly protein [Starkeya sp. ORNL1]|uniref:TadE/TadG family type IV pilus assembly protein n=1 Tax=Starkeya sp. ORNL1 TaxID=2709380 RepID=UPI0014629C37|nr:TadE/TadG family type IV pilus assembly protein [Starkeya sp. ORNL1]QJP15269.1 pilus assembly protein [Starkeya sp. ORNL1]